MVRHTPDATGRGARRDREGSAARQGGERGAPSNGTGAARGNPICARWGAGVCVCAGAGMGAGACGRAGGAQVRPNV